MVILTLAFGGSSASAAAWGENYFPNVPLVTQDGQTVRFYDDLIKGKIVLVNFIYASCKEVCPLVTARMAQLQKQLGDRVGRDIFLYSITLDPIRDTPEALKKHANAFHAGPGWLFLTGKPEDIERVRYKLGERSKSLVDHRNDAIAGNGATGEWERTSLFQDVAQIALTILNMDPAFRAQKDNQPGTAYVNMAPLRSTSGPGQALFLKACASCHTIGQGDLVGPDLQGVTVRRDRAWLSQFMRRPDVMRAKQDPIALALSAKYEGVSMPNLGLSETDVSDLLAYVESQTSRLAAPSRPDADHHH
jgi:protein SCO1/2